MNFSIFPNAFAASRLWSRQRVEQGTMAKTVGDFFWERLYQWGVRRVFGYPGDGINALLGGLQRFGTDKIQFVQARHEEMAAFMASAYAKFTGELGVCIATSGPGASHLITGMYDARMDHMPLLAIAGQQARAAASFLPASANSGRTKMGPQRVRDQALVDFQGHLQRPKRATFEADN